MVRAKRRAVEPTDEWTQLRLFVRSPEQELYEALRPIALFGRTPAARARETRHAECTLRRTADAFDTYGMASLFTPSFGLGAGQGMGHGIGYTGYAGIEVTTSAFGDGVSTASGASQAMKPPYGSSVRRSPSTSVTNLLPSIMWRSRQTTSTCARSRRRASFEHRYASPQPVLWEAPDGEWHLAIRLPPPRPRRPRAIGLDDMDLIQPELLVA